MIVKIIFNLTNTGAMSVETFFLLFQNILPKLESIYFWSKISLSLK